jgi:hypothetical protein
MPRRNVPALLAASALAATLALGGCGIDGGAADLVAAAGPSSAPSPSSSSRDFAALDDAALVKEVRAAAREVRTVHVVLDGTTGEGTIKMDLDVDLENQQYTGTIVLNGHTVEVRRTADAAYFQGDKGFWSSSFREKGAAQAEFMAELLVGKYVRIPESDPRVANFDGLTGAGDMAAMMRKWPAGFTRADAVLDGAPVLLLDAEDPDGTGGMTLYVRKTGSPVPLRVRSAGSDTNGDITWSRFDEPVRIENPSADRTVNLPENA